jgi:hypothetical protein
MTVRKRGLVILGAGCLVAAGCGGTSDGHTGTDSTRHATTQASGTTLSAARRLARAANLRPSDRVSGLERLGATPGEGESRQLFRRCEGGAQLMFVEQSPSFGQVPTPPALLQGYDLLYSTVEVFHTPAGAAAAQLALLSARGLSCVRRAIRVRERKEGHHGVAFTRGTAQIRRSMEVLEGGHAAGGVQLAERLTAINPIVRPRSATLFDDQLSIVVGQVKIALTAARFGRPPSAALERRILLMLQRRAQASLR